MTKVDHPAKFSKGMVDKFAEIIERHFVGWCSQIKILDPFAGTGKIHELRVVDWRFKTYGVEIEPEWAVMSDMTYCFDSRHLHKIWKPSTFDVICTSPTYGNRMADHHDAKDGSKRRTYKHVLGRDLTDGNSGMLQWSPAYRDLHYQVYLACDVVLRPGGLFILNISDHIRKGEVINVAGAHTDILDALGYELIEPWFFPTRRMKFGANANLRTPGEFILVYKKGT